MTDCTHCPTIGRVANPATHRLVLRGTCLPNPEGTPRYVYVDKPQAAVCTSCAALLMAKTPDPIAEVKMIAALQREAISQGWVFPGATYNFGFAELEKPLALVSAEMRQQIDESAPAQRPMRVEGRGEVGEALKENAEGVQQQIIGIGKDGKPLVATIALKVDQPIDRQLLGKNGLFSRVDSIADVPAVPLAAERGQASASDLEIP